MEVLMDGSKVMRSIGLEVVCSRMSRFEGSEFMTRELNEKRQSFKPIMPNLTSTTLSFFETAGRLNYCLTSASKKEGYTNVSISSYSKEDGKRKCLNVCDCEGTVSASELGLLNINAHESMALLVGLDHGLLLIFHFADIYFHSTVKLLEGSIIHIVLVDPHTSSYAQRRNLALVAGSDHSIYMVNCQKRTIVCQFREVTFQQKTPIGLFSNGNRLVHAFNDGHINFWEVGTSVKQKIEELNISNNTNKFRRSRLVTPKHSLQSVTSEGLVAVASLFDCVMVLTRDCWLKALQPDTSLPEAYLVIFEIRLKLGSPPTQLHMMPKEEYALVAAGSTIVQVCFDKQGVYSTISYEIDMAKPTDTIERFFVDEEQQKFISGILNGKFFISKNNSLR